MFSNFLIVYMILLNHLKSLFTPPKRDFRRLKRHFGTLKRDFRHGLCLAEPSGYFSSRSFRKASSSSSSPFSNSSFSNKVSSSISSSSAMVSLSSSTKTNE